MQQMWDQRYAAEEYYYGRDPNPFFRDVLNGLKPGKILLPAEGEGRNAVYAARNGWFVRAMDFSEEGRKKSLRLAEENNVTIDYHIADITTADFGLGLYDAVGLLYVHMDPPQRQRVHHRLMNSLKPGGFLILEAFHKRQIINSSGGPKSEDMLYDARILEGDFRDLEILYLEECTICLDAGEGHRGEAEVVRLTGRK